MTPSPMNETRSAMPILLLVPGDEVETAQLSLSSRLFHHLDFRGALKQRRPADQEQHEQRRQGNEEHEQKIIRIGDDLRIVLNDVIKLGGAEWHLQVPEHALGIRGQGTIERIRVAGE